MRVDEVEFGCSALSNLVRGQGLNDDVVESAAEEEDDSAQDDYGNEEGRGFGSADFLEPSAEAEAEF